MGRFFITGEQATDFLQHVLTNNAAALEAGQSQYTIIPNENGGAIDDSYLYKINQKDYILVVNASNIEKDWEWFQKQIKKFPEANLEDTSEEISMLALQGPKTKRVLETILHNITELPDVGRNNLSVTEFENEQVIIARTGYTGEPLCFEIFVPQEKTIALWESILRVGKKDNIIPAGLGARDSLRLEAGLPLYGHELGEDKQGKEIPILAIPLAKYAVSFSRLKGQFIGKQALKKQFTEFKQLENKKQCAKRYLPKRIMAIAISTIGAARQGDEVYINDRLIGEVRSGSMVSYWKFDQEGVVSHITEEKGKRSICLAYIDSGTEENQEVKIHAKGRILEGVVVERHLSSVAPPYSRTILVKTKEKHAEEGKAQVEPRVISGQQANKTVFSALVDYKNRLDKKTELKRLRKVMNHHLGKGGHLSAQPLGALRHYVMVDPVTEKPAVINFPIQKDNPYKIDLEETEQLIDEHKPELIILGKSMVLHPEPVGEIRKKIDTMEDKPVLMYDMAHVLGLVGPYFQEPFKEGADIVTGSTHKTFFGPQRGVVAGTMEEGTKDYELWETIQREAFPGSTSNHHLGTLLGLLMAAYEMNMYGKEYQKQVILNAKAFAKALRDNGFNVEGDPDVSYTETHQVILNVGYANGAEIAEKLEKNNIIVNYQSIPYDEGFSSSSALRMGVQEMTRFGMKEKDFEKLAEYMKEIIQDKKDIGKQISHFRSNFTEMGYCLPEEKSGPLIKNF
jgi:glycine cleavage system T protein